MKIKELVQTKEVQEQLELLGEEYDQAYLTVSDDKDSEQVNFDLDSESPDFTEIVDHVINFYGDVDCVFEDGNIVCFRNTDLPVLWGVPMQHEQ